MNTKNPPLRIARYCRTSGDSQKDNTSIPRQRESIEAYCKANGWQLSHVYVDESKTGSKIEGRDEFQQMMRDAANEKFDAVVVYDITRFARNGADIIDKAGFLKSTFGIFLVDTKNQFDNRTARNALVNHVFAGISENERLSIMERMTGGRIRRAQEGKPWGTRPYGREYDKTTGTWYVTEKGHQIVTMLERYADGELMADLHKECGFSCSRVAMRIVRGAQLSGTFIAKFNAPDIDIINLEIPVPAVPEVITPELAERVKQRCEHNRTNNKEKLRKYKLTGYIRCATCGAALSSATVKGKQYYRHHAGTGDAGKKCQFGAIPAELIEEQSLGYLYSFYSDEPAFDKAVQQAMPTTEDREAIERLVKRAKGQLSKVERSINNLIKAIEEGGDPSMFINRQNELRAERETLTEKVESLENTLATMPSVELVERQVEVIKSMLMREHTAKDWKTQNFDDIRQFLRFLFGDNPRRNGYGISVSREDDKWRVEFKGRVEFAHQLTDGFATTEAERGMFRSASKLLQTDFDLAIAAIDREFATTSGGIKPDIGPQGIVRVIEQSDISLWEYTGT